MLLLKWYETQRAGCTGCDSWWSSGVWWSACVQRVSKFRSIAKLSGISSLSSKGECGLKLAKVILNFPASHLWTYFNFLNAENWFLFLFASVISRIRTTFFTIIFQSGSSQFALNSLKFRKFISCAAPPIHFVSKLREGMRQEQLWWQILFLMSCLFLMSVYFFVTVLFTRALFKDTTHVKVGRALRNPV